MTNPRQTAAFLAPKDSVDYVFGDCGFKAVAERTNLIAADPCFDIERLRLGDVDTKPVEVLFSTWGVSRLTGEQLDRYFPNLKAVFYAAGTVGHFAAPFLERDITIVSAWRANAVPVAEFTVAQIILALKGYFRNVREYDGTQGGFDKAFRGRGTYGETVSILGAGAIGSRVIRLLKAYRLNVIVWDPFLSHKRADELGVEKVETIDEAFSRGLVVSCHLADKAETIHLINREMLQMLRENAVLINTGRGPTIDEEALVEVCEARRDLTALLDVTHPEPPGLDSRLMAMPNIHISSHIAGSIGDEVHRMADLVIEEFDRYIAGQPLEHQVTREEFFALA